MGNELKKIIEISRSILELYEYLSIQTSYGSTDSSDIVKKIKSLKEEENDFYNKVFGSKTPSEIEEYLEYLEDGIDVTFEGGLNSISNLDKEEIIKLRIFEKLVLILNEMKREEEYEFSEDIKEVYRNILLVDLFVEVDFIRTIIVFLSDEIEKISNEETKLKLIRIKNMLIFMYSYIESEFIKRDFKSVKEIYLGYELLLPLKGINLDTINSSKDNYAKNSLEYALLTLLNAYDYEKEEIVNTDYLVLLSKVIIKTSVFFISKESLDKFLDYASSKFPNEARGYYRIANELMNILREDPRKDLKRIRMLHL